MVVRFDMPFIVSRPGLTVGGRWMRESRSTGFMGKITIFPTGFMGEMTISSSRFMGEISISSAVYMGEMTSCSDISYTARG